jgi:alkylated DNA repair dioxygenase AlkB
MLPSTLSKAGLVLLPDFITSEDEEKFIEFIDSQEWDTSIKRRTQHYGARYNYTTKDAKETVSPIPDIFSPLMSKLSEYLNCKQMIVNEYTATQGIAKHIDSKKDFGPVIVSVSLCSDTNMVFHEPKDEKETILLPRFSALIMRGDSRNIWKHEIPSRKTVVYPDGTSMKKDDDYRRVSLTFRDFKDS